MINRRHLFAIGCILSLLLMALALSQPRTTLGNATVPSRTPRPDPTDDGGGDNGGNDNGGGDSGSGDNDQQPTQQPPAPTLTPTPLPLGATAVPTQVPPDDTPVASPTAVAVDPTETPFTIVPGPEVEATAESPVFEGQPVAFPEDNQAFPQAIPCGMPPTFTSIDAISLFAGPGDDYALVGLLGTGEIRPIVGRAAFTDWWVIQLDSTGRIGWVNDKAGEVHGYAGRVPIISAPQINGIAPTPGGSAWVPTPVPDCDTPELVAAAAAAVVASDEGDFSPPSNKPESNKSIISYDEGTEGAGAAARNPDLVNTNQEAAAEPLLTDLAESAAPLELPEGASSSSQLPNLMPVAGLLLLVAAVFTGLFARRKSTSNNSPGSSTE